MKRYHWGYVLDRGKKNPYVGWKKLEKGNYMPSIQAQIDAISSLMAETRSRYHLTLGQLIGQLHSSAKDAVVLYDQGGSPNAPKSYRGYYSDLAFSTTFDRVTVAELLKECEWVLGRECVGYKGGDYIMGEDTPLWRAEYGLCGTAIVGLVHPMSSQEIYLTTKQVD